MTGARTPAERRAPRALAPSALSLVAVAAAALVATPVLAVLVSLLAPASPLWPQLVATVLPAYVWNSLELAALVALGVVAIGVPAAWLVTMYAFPGRRWVEVALALPLAFPAYVIAYAYTDLLDHPGPVQAGLRAAFGWGPRDYWFPEVRSAEGAAVMLTLVLYPYVYLLARAAFLHQSAGALEVARTLGSGPIRRFLRVGAPMARPAIVTGVALALMETLADFGTVAHFGVQTFTTGIYRAWFSMGDRIAAAQLSSCLLVAVILLILLERMHRRDSRFQTARGAYHALPETRLTGWRGACALALCGLPPLLGFAIPLVMLGLMSAEGGHAIVGARYLTLTSNSFLLAAIASAATVGLAVVLAYAARAARGRAVRAAVTVAALGYAVPGGVIAVGILLPLAALDNVLDGVARAWFGVSTGLLLTGSILALVLAYMVRFMAIALQTVDAALEKVTPSMDHAARALGRSPLGALRDVHAPLVRGGVWTAALIVFVDVMKELPATMILRPFDFDTLAVQAHRLASDERLAEAATPSLVIVLVGLIPVLLLSREIRRSRPGGGPTAG